MHSVLATETAVLVHFETIGSVLLILGCVVISLLTLVASQCDLNSHTAPPIHLPPCVDLTAAASHRKSAHKKTPLRRQVKSVYH